MDEEAKTPDINQARPAASSGGVIGAAGVETQQAAADADNKPANRLENYFATGVQLLTLPGSEIMINDVCWRCFQTGVFWFPKRTSLTAGF